MPVTPTVAALRAPRILVVDDSADSRFGLCRLLEDYYSVVQAASGRDALKIIMSATPPDMVLLDILMPDMDGYEVLRRIRQHAPTANLPVIFLTGLDSPGEQRLGLDLGAIDYLTKPIDAGQLLTRVEAHMAMTTQRRRLDALSEKLARHLPAREWRALFHTAARESICFEQKKLSVLYADMSDHSAWAHAGHEGFGEDVERLAAESGGTIDAFYDHATVVFFEDASACVHMAMELRRQTANLHLRMGIHTGIYELSTFGSDVLTDCTLIGPETGLAAKVAAAASKGGIVLCPETLRLVGDEVHVESDGHLIGLAWVDEMPEQHTSQRAATPQRGRSMAR